MVKIVTLLLALILSYSTFAQESTTNTLTLDRYGGWQELTFPATGYFRIEQTDERFWLVTPEGNAFLSYGINHIEPKWMKRFYNIDYWARQYEVTDYSDRGFHPAFEAKVKEDIQKMGWNTLGCHSSNDYYAQSFIPYVKTVRFVNIHHYQP
ncbi:MAG: hypothetical protein AAF223_22180, partial [Bacteroidota bacterium]